MPKKRATQEEKAARAKARGYVEGAHEEEDNNMTEDQYTDESIKLHERALSSYRDWMGTKDENCLGKGQHTPSLVKIKDFIRFYIISSDGVLSDRPVVSSVLNFAERFFAGFTRVTGSKFDKEITSHVYHWIKYTLPKHHIIENKKRKKLLFTHDDLTNILVTLWTEDDPLFIHERNRIQLTFALLVYCYSGARIGAFVPDLSKAETRGLCYK
ncbi:MAG: hypothetical protein M1834_001007, partial [Cirrosporium novae-zelandiae]